MVVKYIPEGISRLMMLKDHSSRRLRWSAYRPRGFRGPTLNFRDDVVGEFELSHSFLRKTMFEGYVEPRVTLVTIAEWPNWSAQFGSETP